MSRGFFKSCVDAEYVFRFLEVVLDLVIDIIDVRKSVFRLILFASSFLEASP